MDLLLYTEEILLNCNIMEDVNKLLEEYNQKNSQKEQDQVIYWYSNIDTNLIILIELCIFEHMKLFKTWIIFHDKPKRTN